jgi:hypothetical protein
MKKKEFLELIAKFKVGDKIIVTALATKYVYNYWGTYKGQTSDVWGFNEDWIYIEPDPGTDRWGFHRSKVKEIVLNKGQYMSPFSLKYNWS